MIGMHLKSTLSHPPPPSLPSPPRGLFLLDITPPCRLSCAPPPNCAPPLPPLRMRVGPVLMALRADLERLEGRLKRLESRRARRVHIRN